MAIYDITYDFPDGSTSVWTKIVRADVLQELAYDEAAILKYIVDVAMDNMPDGAVMVGRIECISA